MSTLRAFLVWILIFEFTGLGNLSFARAVGSSKVTESKTIPHALTKQVDALIRTDPWIATLEDPSFPLPDAGFHFSVNDPSLDQDPFFMRSQRWIKAPKEALKSDQGVQIVLSDRPSFPALELQAPLHVIGRSDDYVFLAADDLSYFEPKVAWDEESHSKGVFILQRQAWEQAYAQQAPVPLYFLPLPDGDWDWRAQATIIEERDFVQFSDGSGEGGVPVPFSDLELLVKAQNLHLTFARGLNLLPSLDQWKRNSEGRQEPLPLDLRKLLPARGATAGFGVVFTGLNLDSPKHSIDLKALFDETETASVPASRFQKLIERLLPFESAQAADWLTPKMKDRIIRVGVIMGVASVLAVVLRNTVYREHFARLTQQERERRQNDASRIKGSETLKERYRASWVGRNTRYFLTVKAHLLLVLSQFHSTLFGNLTEYLADRYFPKSAGAETGKLRRFLRWTTLRNRENQKRAPVNDKTFLLGTGILGGIDTLLVAYQVNHTTPDIIHWVGENAPGMAERARIALDEGNADIEIIRRNAVISCGVSYLTGGAAAYSIDVQTQYRQIIEPRVDEQMRKEGMDPKDSRFSSLREDRISQELDEELQAKGLPSANEFLFDFNTAHAKILAALGFAPGTSEKLLGSERPGLTLSALEEALRRLRARPQDAETQAAIRLLSHHQKDVSFLRNWIARPIGRILRGENLKDDLMKATSTALEARKTLVSLTYQGPRDLRENAIPGAWAEAIGSEGAELAARVYRESFVDFIAGTTEQQAEAKRVAKAKGRETSAFERWQIRKATRKTDQEYIERYREPFEPVLAEEGQRRYWDERFVYHYANEAGIVMKTPSTEAGTARAQFELSDPETKREMDALEAAKGPRARFEAESIRHAIHEIDLYVENTVNDFESDALSTDQPGITQGLRMRVAKAADGKPWLKRLKAWSEQKASNPSWFDKAFVNPVKSLVRNASPVTRLLRLADSLGSSSSYKLGFWNKLYRGVPMLFDLKQATEITISYIPTTMISGFIFYRYFWGIDNPLAVHAFFSLLTWTVSGPSRTVNRAFQNQGVKPMGHIASAAVLAFIFSWATFTGFIPQQLFAADWMNFWNHAADAIGKIAQTCSSFLLPKK